MFARRGLVRAGALALGRSELLHLADLLEKALVHPDLLLVHRATNSLCARFLRIPAADPGLGARRVLRTGVVSRMLDDELTRLHSLEGKQRLGLLPRGLGLLTLQLVVAVVLVQHHLDELFVAFALVVYGLSLLRELVVKCLADVDVTLASCGLLGFLRLLSLGVSLLRGTEQLELHLPLEGVATSNNSVSHALHGFLDALLAGGPLVSAPLVLLFGMPDGVLDQLLCMKLVGLPRVKATLPLELILFNDSGSLLTLLLLL